MKKWQKTVKKARRFSAKKTDLPIICLPWHFRGSGHTETYFWNKISGLPWNFQPPRCHSRRKNDKKRWKKRGAFPPKKTDLPIICLPWHFRGSGHSKTYFWNKICGLPWKFQPPRCYIRQKITKKRWKNAKGGQKLCKVLFSTLFICAFVAQPIVWSALHFQQLSTS